MFATLFKQKNTTRDQAHTLYVDALNNTRTPVFYTHYGVPDTFDGRFDLLLVHVFIILKRRMDDDNYTALSQALFDVVFKNMDQTLREMGIGDMGIPKHMKRMMKAFNGRMHSYQIALDPQSLADSKIEGLTPTSLEDALKRNLYGTVTVTNEEGAEQTETDKIDNAEHESALQRHTEKMASFIRHNIEIKESGAPHATFENQEEKA